VLSAAIDKQIATGAFKEGAHNQDDDQYQADDSWACLIQDIDAAEGVQSEIAPGGDTSVISSAPQGMDL